MNGTEEIVNRFEDFQLDVDLADIVRRAGIRRRKRKTLSAAMASGALVVAVVVGVMASSPPVQAFWAPIPTTPDIQLTSDAGALCSAQWGSDNPSPPPLLVIDQRGDAALAVFAGRSSDPAGPRSTISTCTLIREDGQWHAPPASDLPFRAVTMAGEIGTDGATKVVIDQSDGIRVEAAIDNGYFHFWWPDTQGFPGGTLLVLDADGNVLSSGALQPMD